jgi:hypothetical protein
VISKLVALERALSTCKRDAEIEITLLREMQSLNHAAKCRIGQQAQGIGHRLHFLCPFGLRRAHLSSVGRALERVNRLTPVEIEQCRPNCRGKAHTSIRFVLTQQFRTSVLNTNTFTWSATRQQKCATSATGGEEVDHAICCWPIADIN